MGFTRKMCLLGIVVVCACGSIWLPGPYLFANDEEETTTQEDNTFIDETTAKVEGEQNQQYVQQEQKEESLKVEEEQGESKNIPQAKDEQKKDLEEDTTQSNTLPSTKTQDSKVQQSPPLQTFASTIHVNDAFTQSNEDGISLNYTVLSVDPLNQVGTVILGKTGGVFSDHNALTGVLSGSGVLRVPSSVLKDGYTFTVKEIGKHALCNANIKELYLPKESLTELKDYALHGNPISYLHIPEGVTRIGDMAFVGDSSNPSKNQLRVLKLPSTLDSIGANLIQEQKALTSIYFPIDNAAFVKGETGSSNLPFYSYSGNKASIIVKTKEQYEKWRVDKSIISTSIANSKNLVTYEMDVGFYDRDLNKLELPTVKKLFGKSVAFHKDTATEQWDYVSSSTCSDLPSLPTPSQLGYTANYWGINKVGLATVDKNQVLKDNEKSYLILLGYYGYDAYNSVVDNKIIAVEEELKESVQGIKKTFDNKASGVNFNINRPLDDEYFANTSRTVSISLKPENAEGTYYSYIFRKLPTEIGTTKDENSLTNGFKNVADSGTYFYKMVLNDSTLHEKLLEPKYKNVWYSNPDGDATEVIVDIKPADISIKAKVEQQEIIWNNQTELPPITLSKGDSEGEIKWDDGQIPKEGKHSYTYTFVPDHLYADGIKGKHIANYTETQKKGTMEITYKPASKESFTVIFKGLHHEILKTEEVEKNLNAHAPIPPQIKGYRFVKWNKAFDHIVEDTTIMAIYEKREYIVTYLDEDGTVIHRENVKYDEDAKSAPTMKKAGHIFIGWDASLEHIQSDIKVRAIYEKQEYIVTYLDEDGNVIHRENVKYDEDAKSAPSMKKTGHIFIGWDASLEHIQSNIKVRAIYEKQQYTITYLADNGTIILRENVKYGEDAKFMPSMKKAGYHFLGWDASLKNIHEDRIVHARYEKIEEVIEPVVTLPEHEQADNIFTTPPLKEDIDQPVHNDKTSFVENKDLGIKVASKDREKIFDSDIVVKIEQAPEEERTKAEQKLKNVIKVIDVTLERDGVKVEQKINKKIQLTLNLKDYKQYKDIKIYQKNAQGVYVELPYQIKDDTIIFECDALDTYALTGTMIDEIENICPMCGSCACFFGICTYAWGGFSSLLLVGGMIWIFRKKRKV